MAVRKSVVVAVWKHEGGEIEVYTSLLGFLEHNKGFKQGTIENYLSRKKTPYEDDKVKLLRTNLIQRL